jgi:hypothetical protein
MERIINDNDTFADGIEYIFQKSMFTRKQLNTVAHGLGIKTPQIRNDTLMQTGCGHIVTFPFFFTSVIHFVTLV